MERIKLSSIVIASAIFSLLLVAGKVQRSNQYANSHGGNNINSKADSNNNNHHHHHGASSSDHDKRCEEITVPMCRSIGYNTTSMPNQFHHETQDEAGLEVHQFFPLVEISCSEDLRFFLCSLYTPICMEDYQGSVPACRSVCERAKQGCEPLMIQYGFSWPEHMNCTKFPVYGDPLNICMDARMTADHTASVATDSISAGSGAAGAGAAGVITANNEDNNGAIDNNNNNNKHQAKSTNKDSRLRTPNVRKSHHQTHYTTEPYGSAYPGDTQNRVIHHVGNHVGIATTATSEDDTEWQQRNRGPGGIVHSVNSVLRPTSNCRCDCREPYFVRIRPDSFHHHHVAADHHVGIMPQPQIYPANYFNHSRIETAGGLAPSCAAACTKGSYNFTELERDSALSWIHITAMVCVVTCTLTFLTYLIDSQRFRYPERAIIFLAACYICVAGGYLLRLRLGHGAIACDGAVIRYQRTGPTPAACLLSFILLYFFGMASAYWWLILTLTWFLAAGLKWGSEAITGYAQYFHLLAWLLPTAQSVAILCLGAIDGDPLVGVCTVGNQSRANLLVFVITPLCVCIAIGSLFLIAGFVALFRIRQAIQQRQNIRVKTDTLEKLMMKIGISSFFYIVPEGIVLMCHIYEYLNRPAWERSLTCICGNETPEAHQPQFSMILPKYIMSLIIGITSGFWIWSGKTLDSWLQFFNKFTCCKFRKLASPSISRSGASQLLPNVVGYYGRGVALGVTGGGASSLPMKTQTVNLTNSINGANGTGTNTANSTPQHLLHQQRAQQTHGNNHYHHNNNGNHHAHHHPLHHPLHSHHGLELQPRGGQNQTLIHPLPSLPPSLPPPLPPPPPPQLMIGSHHGGSLTGSQFTHLIGSINGAALNGNPKGPLSHV